MPDEDILERLDVRILPPGYAPGGFDCGEADITEYLIDGSAERDRLASYSVTYVLLEDEECVGYFSVLADAIRLQGKEKPDGITYPTAPALKLGRMGVDQNYQGMNLGFWILDVVVGMARSISERAGVRYVTLDAMNEKLVDWYSNYGFERNHGEADSRIAMRQFWGRWKKGDSLRETSMRYDILLEGELVAD